MRTWAGRWESLPGETWKRLEVWNRETDISDHLWKPPSVLCSALLPFLSANWAQPPWSWEVMGASQRLHGTCLPVVGLGSAYTASDMHLRALDGGGAWQEGDFEGLAEGACCCPSWRQKGRGASPQPALGISLPLCPHSLFGSPGYSRVYRRHTSQQSRIALPNKEENGWELPPPLSVGQATGFLRPWGLYSGLLDCLVPGQASGISGISGWWRRL